MKYPNDELFLKQFGKNIRDLRMKNNLTQRDLADKSGLEESAIQRIERGYNSTLKTLLKLANALNISLEEFFKESFENSL